MNRSTRNALSTAAVTATALALGGCATQHLSNDFGQAVRQSIAQQIANPDTKYVGAIAPGSNAARVAAAQDRYVKGRVIQPSAQVAATSVAAAPSSAPSGLSQ